MNSAWVGLYNKSRFVFRRFFTLISAGTLFTIQTGFLWISFVSPARYWGIILIMPWPHPFIFIPSFISHPTTHQPHLCNADSILSILMMLRVLWSEHFYPQITERKIFISAVYDMDLAASKNHHVSTRSSVHHWGTWLQPDDVLCPCGASRTNIADD